MLSGLNPAIQNTINSMELIQQQFQKAESQISSGLRISRASDEPQTVPDLLNTRSDMARISQVQSNLALAKGEADAADTSLQDAVQVLQNAATLATQAANGTSTPEQMSVIAGQISGLLNQLVADSRAQANGQYIFSGDQPNTAPYQLDPANPNTVDQLVTAPATRLIQDATGLTFAASKTAQEIFDVRDGSGNPTTGNAFAALQNLVTALQSNNQANVQAAIGDINSAHSYVGQQLAFYGSVQSRISLAQDLANKFQVQDQTRLSAEQDTDIAATAIQVTQLNTQMNAALAGAAKQRTTSLFDYMPTK